MEMILTAKICLKPTAEQAAALERSMALYAKGCNLVSKYIFDNHDLCQKDVHDATYAGLRAIGLKSQMACDAPRNVIGSYKSMLSNNHDRWDRVHQAEYNGTAMILTRDRNWSFGKGMNTLSVGTLEGRELIAYDKSPISEKYLDGKHELGTATVFKGGCGRKRWFASIAVAVEVPSKPEYDSMRNVVGVDRGMRFIAVSYDSKHRSLFFPGSRTMAMRKHYSKLRKGLQKRHTPSSRRRILAISQRENRWVRDENHRIAKTLVDSNPEKTLFVLEDLDGIQNAADDEGKERRRENHSWAFKDLQSKIECKAKAKGDLVVYVNPYKTSQKCPMCGHTEKSNRDKRKHLFHCKACGFENNDDRIAAINLQHMGVDLVHKRSQKAYPDGEGSVNEPGKGKPLRDATVVEGAAECSGGQSQAPSSLGRGN